MQVLKPKEPDIFERLLTMSPEEGVGIMRQLFNPMRGKHVGFREADRSTSCELAPKEQDKMQEEINGRIIG